MQIVIDIPKEMHKAFVQGSFGAKYNMYDLVGCVMNGTPLPDNATNGDIIQTIYPHYTFEIESFEGFVRCSYDGWYIRLPICWWDAPYKVGDIEESDAEFMCKVMSKTVNKSTDDRNFIGGF